MRRSHTFESRHQSNVPLVSNSLFPFFSHPSNRKQDRGAADQHFFPDRHTDHPRTFFHPSVTRFSCTSLSPSVSLSDSCIFVSAIIMFVDSIERPLTAYPHHFLFLFSRARHFLGRFLTSHICRIYVYVFSNSSLFCFTLQRYSAQRAKGTSLPYITVVSSYFSFFSFPFFLYFLYLLLLLLFST